MELIVSWMVEFVVILIASCFAPIVDIINRACNTNPNSIDDIIINVIKTVSQDGYIAVLIIAFNIGWIRIINNIIAPHPILELLNVILVFLTIIAASIFTMARIQNKKNAKKEVVKKEKREKALFIASSVCFFLSILVSLTAVVVQL